MVGCSVCGKFRRKLGGRAGAKCQRMVFECTVPNFIDPCGLGALMPEEETESQEEVRSQRRRSLPNGDE